MREAFVSLYCLVCESSWEERSHGLPEPGSSWECGGCGEERSLSEFMQTVTDLEVIAGFHGEDS